MSYILDALRKSEHERQAASGQSVGMLYPIEIQRDRKLWLPIGIALLGVLITSVLVWWLWLKPDSTINSNETVQPTTTAVTQTFVTSQKVAREPENGIRKSISEASPKAVKRPSSEKAQLKPSVQTEAKKGAEATVAQVTNVDPLNDLPALNITGYIHDEQGGNLAMINNQLVREGEEIVPGLRLVKILDNSAIFSYKGYVFSR